MIKILSLFFSLAVFAEEPPDLAENPELMTRLGFQAGLNVNDYEASDTSPLAGSVRGVTYGAVMMIPMSGVLGVQGEIRYLSRGFTYPGRSYESGRVSYLDFPLGLRVNYLRHTALKAYLLFGGDLGLKVQQEAIVKDPGIYEIESYSFTYVDIGALAGLGFFMEVMPTIDLFLQGIYTHGLKDVVKTSGIDYRSRTFSASIGLMMPI